MSIPARITIAAATALALTACSGGVATTDETYDAAASANPASTASAHPNPDSSPTATASPTTTAASALTLDRDATTASAETFSLTSASLDDSGVWDTDIIGSALGWCNGPGDSPEMTWTAPPEGTVGFAVSLYNLTHDGFVYWHEYDIDPTVRGVAQGHAEELEGTVGRANAGGATRVSPCPEVGETHTIELSVYALSESLGRGGLPPFKVQERLQEIALASAVISGTVTGPESLDE